MRITEIINTIYCYAATIRATHGETEMAKKIIRANDIRGARELLIAMYGNNSVVSIIRVNEDHFKETAENKTQLQTLPTLLPFAYKHELAQKALINNMKQNSLRVKSTIDDFEAARGDFEAEQKRVNREYERAQKWVAIRKRKLKLFF